MTDPQDEGEVMANRMIASTILSEEAQQSLLKVDPETRIAIEGLIADGLVEEREVRIFPTDRGIEIVSRLEGWFDGE
jgi:arginine/ornithine N-succinyltransferase beta subunit